VHLIGVNIKIYHGARSPKRQIDRQLFSRSTLLVPLYLRVMTMIYKSKI